MVGRRLPECPGNFCRVGGVVECEGKIDLLRKQRTMRDGRMSGYTAWDLSMSRRSAADILLSDSVRDVFVRRVK